MSRQRVELWLAAQELAVPDAGYCDPLRRVPGENGADEGNANLAQVIRNEVAVVQNRLLETGHRLALWGLTVHNQAINSDMSLISLHCVRCVFGKV